MHTYSFPGKLGFCLFVLRKKVGNCRKLLETKANNQISLKKEY